MKNFLAPLLIALLAGGPFAPSADAADNRNLPPISRPTWPTKRGCGPNARLFMGQCVRVPALELVLRFVYGAVGAATYNRVPACTDDPDCLAVCRVGAVTGSTTTAECVGHDGTAFGTMANNTGLTTIPSFIPGVWAWEVGHVETPVTVTSTELDALTARADGYTILIGSLVRQQGDNYYWGLHAEGGGGYVDMYAVGGAFRCSYGADEVVGSLAFGGYQMVGCRNNGSTEHSVMYQTDLTSGSFAKPTAVSGGNPWRLGNRVDGALGWNGPVVFYAFFKGRKTDAWMRDTLDKFQGVYNAGIASWEYRTSQRLGIDHTSTTGNIDLMNDATALSTDVGLQSVSGFTNFWAADPLDATSWTAVGSPVVTANVRYGPFGAAKKANTADRIYDDDGAAFEGAKSLTAGTTADWYSASCYVEPGTSDAGTVINKGNIFWETTGVSGTTNVATLSDGGLMDYFELDGGLLPDGGFRAYRVFSKASFNATNDGGTTGLYASVRIGHTAAETGNLVVGQCQLTKRSDLRPPNDNGSVVSDAHYVGDPPNSGWPDISLGGKYEVIHMPAYDANETWWTGAFGGPAFPYYFFDPTQSGGAHAGTFIWGYQLPGRSYAQGIVTTGPISLIPGRLHADSIEWTKQANGKCNFVVKHDVCAVGVAAADCEATTIINSDSTGTLDCILQPDDLMLGDRYSTGYPTNAEYAEIRISALQ